MYLDDASAAISGFEGRVHWMYLDEKGNVTTAVGQLLRTSEDALLYPFKRQNGEFATHDEIIAQFEEVKAMQPGLKAASYRRFESLLLTDDDIDKMLRATVFRSACELGWLFDDFHDYPDAAKIGLLDMIFNLGLAGIRDAFPQFCRAVKEQRWDAAAAQCHRAGISEERNDWAQEQFRQAAAAEARI